MKKLAFFLFIFICHSNAQAAKGNGHLPGKLPANKIFYLGAHNSFAAKKLGWRYYQHKSDLKRQFEKGVRGAKIVVHWHQPHKGFLIKKKKGRPFIALCHEKNSKSNCKLTKWQRKGNKAPDPALRWLKELKKQLDQHPRDVFMLILQSNLQKVSKKSGTAGYKAKDIRKKIKDLFKDAGLSTYVYTLKKGEKWPTLGEMRSKNKRLLLFYESASDAFVPTDFGGQQNDFMRVTQWKYNEYPNCEMKEKNSQPFLRLNHSPEVSVPKGTKKAPLFRILNKFNKTLVVSDYRKINGKKEIMRRINLCQKEQDPHLGMLVLLDFSVDYGQGGKVVETLNKKRAEDFKKAQTPTK